MTPRTLRRWRWTCFVAMPLCALGFIAMQIAMRA